MTFPDFDTYPSGSDEGPPQVFTVSQITARVKSIIDASFPSVWVEGEVSNFIHHRSGHMYFTLKDARAELKAVMFRGDNSRLKFIVEDGMQVLANGNITVYEPRGVYQLVVRQMERAGIGTLYLAFEALKKKLAEEGLFDEKIKRPIPRFPSRVGIVTSGTGAAIRDIINVLGRRAPHVQMVLRPTLVQGEGAGDDIVKAIRDFQEFGEVDVLIVGRGGGSLEDLWAFNEEQVARAMAACSIPVISAVGHETDFTITDFVADLRAPTPSAAAELVSPAREELIAQLDEADRRCREAVRGRIELWWQRLDGLTARYGFQQPQILVGQKQQRVRELQERIARRILFILSLQQAHFQGLNDRLLSASPKSILERGYSIAYSIPDRQIVNRVEKLGVGEVFGLIMSDGELTAEAKDIRKSAGDDG